MHLILAGCEYAGTTTLAGAISEWAGRVIGGTFGFHDHFLIPHIGHPPPLGQPGPPDEEQKQILALPPNFLGAHMTYLMHYHLSPGFYKYTHHNLVGFHINNAVYGPLLFGYGEDGPVMRKFTQNIDHDIMKMAPDTVLILVKASPEVIASRMKENPHQNSLLQEKDIELVLQRFETEFNLSSITFEQKFTLDTSTAAVEETMAEFVEQYQPRMSEVNRLKILTRRLPT